MSRPSSFRMLLTATAIGALAVTSGLFTAAPANAAPGSLTIDPPSLSERIVTLTGAGTDGGSIRASIFGSVVAETVVSGERWTVSIGFPESSAVDQTITVTQTVAEFPQDPDEVAVDITLPAPRPAGVIVIVDPDATAALTSPIVTFTGSAPPGSRLEGTGFENTLTQESDGSFSFSTVLTADFGEDQTFTVSGFDGNGIALDPVSVSVTVPPAIAAPVILSPVTGSTLAGPDVTLSGTGVPGVKVQFRVIPRDDATLQANGGAVDGGPLLSVVTTDANGRWSKTLGRDGIAPGNYSFTALHTTGDVFALLDGAALSELSNTVDFSVRGTRAPELAATGPVSGALIAPATGFLAAGLTMLTITRRRRDFLHAPIALRQPQ